MTLLRKLKGVAQIFRPELPLAAGVCVIFGEFLALGKFPSFLVVGLGFLCGFFLSGSALVINDYFDLEVDRINAPQRPLPSGVLTSGEVIGLGIFATLAGFVAAWGLNPSALGFSLIVWLIGFLYNWKLKAAGLWGNLMVGISVGMTFVLGGIGVGQPWSRAVWFFALVVLLFDLAEEIAGDAMDLEGDRKRSAKTIALLHGRQTALRISCALIGLVILLSFLPVLWGTLGLRYLVVIAVVDLLAVYFAIRLWKSGTPVEGRRAMRGLYLSASAGLLAYILSLLILK